LLTSTQYADDVNEARLLGAQNISTRTLDQTAAAGFHAAPDLAYLKPAMASRTLPLIETARAVALYYMARTDAGTAFLEAQYAYSFWRPYHAIRLADTDGNDATTANTTWKPLWDTPNHPEYPSGTCRFTTASIEVLMHFYGDEFSFTATYQGSSHQWTRKFDRLSAVPGDAVVGRIAAGAHFRTACVTGVEMGRNIAGHALENFLRPVPQFTGTAQPKPGEFQLHLNPGRAFSYVLETSGDLSQWTPWQTNALGVASHSDVAAGGADRRFYRALIRP
jgi:hypothetical protein